MSLLAALADAVPLMFSIAGVAEYKGTKLLIEGDQAKWFLLTFKLLELKITVEEKKKSILYFKKKSCKC